MIAKGSMYPNSIYCLYYLRTWTLRDLQFVSWVSKVDPEPASTLNPKVKGRSIRVSLNGLCNYRVPDNVRQKRVQLRIEPCLVFPKKPSTLNYNTPKP